MNLCFIYILGISPRVAAAVNNIHLIKFFQRKKIAIKFVSFLEAYFIVSSYVSQIQNDTIHKNYKSITSNKI
jgi:hypothetical protein